MLLRFEIPGYVQPKQRTFGNRFVTPPETRQYERHVRSCATLAMIHKRPYSGFIGLEIEIICSVPKSWSKKKKELAWMGKIFPTHCDIDNQVKAISDAMNRVVYDDDRRVNSLVVRREYGPEDRAIVTVRGLAEES